MTDAPAPEVSGAPEFPEMEQQLLGLVLTKSSLMEHVADVVSSDHFVEESYGRIWSVFLDMYRRDVPFSMPAALEPIVDELGWERAETMKLLIFLMQHAITPTVSQAQYCAQMVRDVWRRREVYFLAHDMLRRVQGGLDNNASQIIEETEAKLYTVAQSGSVDQERGETFGDAVDQGLDLAHAAFDQTASGELAGVPSGLSIIDKKLGGFRDTDLLIVGSRPGMGKTSFSLRTAKAAAAKFLEQNPEKPEWVMFFSMEMTADQLALRQLSAEARISFEKIRLGTVGADHLIRLDEAAKGVRGLPIRIDDTARLNVPAMRTRVRRWSRRHGRVGLVIIDYLQLIGLSRDEMRDTGNNRVQEISLITRNLKALAKDLGVPVICLAQLNREVEKREDKRPQLSDLRESGSIEQDADVVAFLYREHYYLAGRPPAKKDRESEFDHNARRVDWQIALDKVRDSAEFILAKNRHGSLGTLVLRFTAELMLFEDDTPGDASPEAQAERARQYQIDLENRL